MVAMLSPSPPGHSSLTSLLAGRDPRLRPGPGGHKTQGMVAKQSDGAGHRTEQVNVLCVERAPLGIIPEALDGQLERPGGLLCSHGDADRIVVLTVLKVHELDSHLGVFKAGGPRFWWRTLGGRRRRRLVVFAHEVQGRFLVAHRAPPAAFARRR